MRAVIAMLMLAQSPPDPFPTEDDGWSRTHLYPPLIQVMAFSTYGDAEIKEQVVRHDAHLIWLDRYAESQPHLKDRIARWQQETVLRRDAWCKLSNARNSTEVKYTSCARRQALDWLRACLGGDYYAGRMPPMIGVIDYPPLPPEPMQPAGEGAQ